MASRGNRPLKVIAFNASGIGRQRHELSKQLQDLRTYVALFSQTHLKPHDRFHIQYYNFYRIVTRKDCNCSQKRHPRTHVDLSPLVSVEPIGFCIPFGNQEILIPAVYKSPRHA
jgi:hypothetical protein